MFVAIELSLAAASVASMAFCSLGWPLRSLGKRLKRKENEIRKSSDANLAGNRKADASNFPSRAVLRKISKFLHTHHQDARVVMACCMGAHACWNLFVIHRASFTGFVLLALVVALNVNGSKKRDANWLHVHRTFCSVAVVVCAVHIARGLTGMLPVLG